MFCTSCGAHLGGRERFCPYCGAKTMFDSEDTAPLNGNEGETKDAFPHAETAQGTSSAPLGTDTQNAEIDRGGADTQNAAFVPQNVGTSPENGNAAPSGENVALPSGAETAQKEEPAPQARAEAVQRNTETAQVQGGNRPQAQNDMYGAVPGAVFGFGADSHPQAQSGNDQNAQNGYANNPYAQQSNAFGASPYAQNNNPYAQDQNNPYAQNQKQPFAQNGQSAFSGQNPQGNYGGGQNGYNGGQNGYTNNPYAQGGNNPYAQNGNNYSSTPFGMPYVQRSVFGNFANGQEPPVNPYGKQNPYLPKPGYSLLTDDFYGKNKLSAGAYGILFGMFGGNCFYLGNIWGGILSLLSFFLGVILAAADAADAFGIVFILLPEVVNAVFGFLYLFQDDRKFIRHISPKIRYRDTISRIG